MNHITEMLNGFTTTEAAAILAKARKQADRKANPTDTKANRMYELLTRPGGASIQELMETAGWQQHSVRGWISNQRKSGATIINADRRYYA